VRGADDCRGGNIVGEAFITFGADADVVFGAVAFGSVVIGPVAVRGGAATGIPKGAPVALLRGANDCPGGNIVGEAFITFGADADVVFGAVAFGPVAIGPVAVRGGSRSMPGR
jgi:hypothetical protein